MLPDDVKAAVKAARAIQDGVKEVGRPPSEIMAPYDQPVLPHTLFSHTRGYIEKIVYQINLTYSESCYDACAVMIRRLAEVLIIEAFDNNGMTAKITDTKGDFFYLNDLIDAALAETSWGKLNRNTRNGLPKLKNIGDQSAHGRYYNARRGYIDDVISVLRTASEDLLYKAKLKT